MPSVVSLDQLLTTCLKDLRKGEDLLLERLPALVAEVGDEAVAAILRRRLTTIRQRAETLDRLGEELGVDPMGEENVWMTGILDDAKGDTETEEPGLLLDIALIGAIRKMIAASLVSYETAVAVAGALGKGGARSVFQQACDDDAGADRALRHALFVLTSG